MEDFICRYILEPIMYALFGAVTFLTLVSLSFIFVYTLMQLVKAVL